MGTGWLPKSVECSPGVSEKPWLTGPLIWDPFANAGFNAKAIGRQAQHSLTRVSEPFWFPALRENFLYVDAYQRGAKRLSEKTCLVRH